MAGNASTVILSFDVDAESAILARGRRYSEHAMVMTHQAFGPRVGVPRLIALLREFGISATFFVPGLTAERYPDTVDAILAEGHEVAHHSYSHRSAVDLTAGEERRDFERGLEALRRAGAEVQGHRAALWEASWQTPTLAAEYGLRYDSSLMDADTPYRLATPAGEVIELCPFWGLDDWEQYAFLPRPRIGEVIQSPLTVAQMWIHELDAMRRYGALLLLTCHPFLSGRAGRTEALRILLEVALERGDVGFATCSELALRAAADPQLELRSHAPIALDEEQYPDH